MKAEEIREHISLLEAATKKAGRRLTVVECNRMGILLYESKKKCLKHGHNIKRLWSFACPDCQEDYAYAYKELGELEKMGLIRKVRFGRRTLWEISNETKT